MAFKVHDKIVAKSNPKWPGKIIQCLGVQPGDKRAMYYVHFDHLGNGMNLLYFEDTLMLESDYKKEQETKK